MDLANVKLKTLTGQETDIFSLEEIVDRLQMLVLIYMRYGVLNLTHCIQ